MINGFAHFTAKCPYGEKCHDEVSLRRSVLTAKCPYGEVAVWRNVPRQKQKIRETVKVLSAYVALLWRGQTGGATPDAGQFRFPVTAPHNMKLPSVLDQRKRSKLF